MTTSYTPPHRPATKGTTLIIEWESENGLETHMDKMNGREEMRTTQLLIQKKKPPQYSGSRTLQPHSTKLIEMLLEQYPRAARVKNADGLILSIDSPPAPLYQAVSIGGATNKILLISV